MKLAYLAALASFLVTGPMTEANALDLRALSCKEFIALSKDQLTKTDTEAIAAIAADARQIATEIIMARQSG
jgi:hypothetical protein